MRACPGCKGLKTAAAPRPGPCGIHKQVFYGCLFTRTHQEASSKPRPPTHPLLTTISRLLYTSNRLAHQTGTQATGTNTYRAHLSAGQLVAHIAQVGIKTALGLDVGMAYQIANLWLFTTKLTFSAHTVLLWKAGVTRIASQNALTLPRSGLKNKA